ncbi:hypothetical protein OIU13_15050 [Brevundimonas sp. BT-123]|uniref:hypothetical protein n=1 Tax=Brevundimonas sp. BT-123 TaxID=2986928 RepID=UPI00223660A6|nr:hypothetical protein [Brevundimonas sp. BT-123]MCW0047839.1 hypothetical protein [Brevundimonas sp. BT-123]
MPGADDPVMFQLAAHPATDRFELEWRWQHFVAVRLPRLQDRHSSEALVGESQAKAGRGDDGGLDADVMAVGVPGGQVDGRSADQSAGEHARLRLAVATDHMGIADAPN